MIWRTGEALTNLSGGHFADKFRKPNTLHQSLPGFDKAMLKIVSQYWGVPSRKKIECYVVVNSNNWPDDVLPPQAKAQVSQGGITLAQGIRQGRQLDMTAVVYASADFGTPLHEAVHAYCYQNYADMRELPPESGVEPDSDGIRTDGRLPEGLRIRPCGTRTIGSV